MLRGNKDSFLSRIICLCQARLVEPIVREQWREEAGKRRIVPFSRIHLTEHRVYSTLRTGRERERGERPPSMAEEEGRMTSHFKRNSSEQRPPRWQQNLFPFFTHDHYVRATPPLRQRRGAPHRHHLQQEPCEVLQGPTRRQASGAGVQFTKPTPSSRGGRGRSSK